MTMIDTARPRARSRRSVFALAAGAAAAPAAALAAKPASDPVIELYDVMQRLDGLYLAAREG
jgi:hypothetical protein